MWRKIFRDEDHAETNTSQTLQQVAHGQVLQ